MKIKSRLLSVFLAVSVFVPAFSTSPAYAQLPKIPKPAPKPTPTPTPAPPAKTTASPQPTTTTQGAPAGPTQPQSGNAAALLSQGQLQLKRGYADKALSSLQQALTLFTQSNNNKGVAKSREALGDLYNVQGQYNVAFTQYAEATKAYMSANDNYNANLSWAKAADMLFRQGDLANALAAYQRMSVTKPDTNPVGRASSGMSIFNQARSGGVSGAVGAVSEGIALIEKERNAYRQFMIYAVYENGLGRIDFAKGQYDSAKAHFDNTLKAADNPFYVKWGQGRRWRIAARTSLGDVAMVQNKYGDAIKLYNNAISDAKKDKRLDLTWPAQRGLGRAYWQQAAQEKDAKKATQGRENAIAAYREALNTIETIRQGTLSADESRSTFLSTTKDVFDDAIGMFSERALMNAQSGTPLSGPALNDAAEAFKIAEQSRARSLLDMLSETGVNLTEGVPADLLKRKGEIQARQQEIAEALTGASFSEETNKKSNTDLEKELDALTVELDGIETQIHAASPRYASLTKPQPLTLAEVQQQVIDDNTTLLEYGLGQQASYLWAVTKTSVSLFKLPARAEIDNQAIAARVQMIPEKLRAPIAGINLPAQPTRGLGLSSSNAGPATAFAESSNKLYQTIVAPASSVIGKNRILVVADGALNYVPFEALVTQPGGSDYASLPYLVKTNEIAYAPSSSVIGVIRKLAAAKPANKNILLVADPVFNSDDPRAKGVTNTVAANADTRGLGLSSALTDVAGTPSTTNTGAPVQGLMLARLQGTRAEAEQIAKFMQTSGGKADLLLDLNANEETVQMRDLKNYRIVHIATHGFLNAERPQFSGLVLSLIGNKQGDGFLRTDEIFNLKLGAPLIMLSACETGLGKEKRGEGVIGLTRAFMYAGAPTVGVSLWSVADNSTALLMADFYKRMLTGPGMSPNAAMRASQIAMIDAKKYSAPFFWAPFVLIGDWR
jgi:CHAT domain-containing protein/tetratricopeptide (TPR) repeat protein